MASGNEENPPQLQGRRERRSSEGHVAQEAEEVFQAFAAYRYQQEREERGAEVPPDPEMEQIQRDRESMGSRVGQRLAIIGDDIYQRYDAEFRTLLENLQPTCDNAYEHFSRIASSLFETDINWGRVIILLAFGYCMALHVWRRGVGGFLRRIARYLSRFILHNHVAHWIAQQGGWRVVLDLDNVYVNYVLLAAVVVLGLLAVQRFFTS